jgi:hypothetical protein
MTALVRFAPMRIGLGVWLIASVAWAQVPRPLPPPAAPVVPSRLALFRLDPLGLPPEIVEQLEGILRVELGRAAQVTLPPRSAIDEAVAKSPRFAGCTADPVCLAPLAKELGVKRIVAGSVGGLGDSYIVNLKLVDDTGRELGRVNATLHGKADELIQEVRVACYKLIAPQKLVGAISLLSEMPGATVTVDDRPAGTTPLAGPIEGLAVGDHTLRVARAGYADFVDQVPVRFEKATEVVVHQKAVTLEARIEEAERVAPPPPEPPVYARWWFWAGTSAVVIGLGVLLGGFLAGHQQTVVMQ